jgi:hypothetical protein
MGLRALWTKGPSLQIDPAALAASIGALPDLDLERGLTTTLQQVVLAARTLFGADGAGLMLADADGELRWASATDQQSQLVEEDQERLGKGPCRAAFSQRMAIAVHNASTEPDPDGSRSVLRSAGFQGALSVPVEVHGGPIGSLDLYSSQPRDWDDSEIGALQAYAGIVANLLGSAAAAHVKGRLADQLQAALAHGAVIEQAKGALMDRHGSGWILAASTSPAAPTTWHCQAGRRPSRSDSGPRPKRCTRSAPWRSRRLAGEVLSRASARRAACPSAHAAAGAATMASASRPTRRLVRYPMVHSLNAHVRPLWLFSYRRSRLSSTVPTTEATSENRTISRHPGQPPSGRICTRPGLMALAPAPWR